MREIREVLISIPIKTAVLADMIGVTGPTVRAWKCGAQKIPPGREAKILAISEGLEVLKNGLDNPAAGG